MIIKFATRRNATTGRRRYLAIDTDRKIYALEPARWFCREDFTEISVKDLHRLIDQTCADGYRHVDTL